MLFSPAVLSERALCSSQPLPLLGMLFHALPLSDAKLLRQVIKCDASLLILRCFPEPGLTLSSLDIHGAAAESRLRNPSGQRCQQPSAVLSAARLLCTAPGHRATRACDHQPVNEHGLTPCRLRRSVARRRRRRKRSSHPGVPSRISPGLCTDGMLIPSVLWMLGKQGCTSGDNFFLPTRCEYHFSCSFDFFLSYLPNFQWKHPPVSRC